MQQDVSATGRRPLPTPRVGGSDGLAFLDVSGLRFEDPSEDIRRRAVRSWDGADLGCVDALVVDRESRTVRYLQLGSGGLLGIRRSRRLVPVDAIVAIAPAEVLIEESGMSPPWRARYRPRLVEEPWATGGDVAYWAWGFIYPVRYHLAAGGPRAARDAHVVTTQDEQSTARADDQPAG